MFSNNFHPEKPSTVKSTSQPFTRSTNSIFTHNHPPKIPSHRQQTFLSSNFSKNLLPKLAQKRHQTSAKRGKTVIHPNLRHRRLQVAEKQHHNITTHCSITSEKSRVTAGSEVPRVTTVSPDAVKLSIRTGLRSVAERRIRQSTSRDRRSVL